MISMNSVQLRHLACNKMFTLTRADLCCLAPCDSGEGDVERAGAANHGVSLVVWREICMSKSLIQ